MNICNHAVSHISQPFNNNIEKQARESHQSKIITFHFDSEFCVNVMIARALCYRRFADFKLILITFFLLWTNLKSFFCHSIRQFRSINLFACEFFFQDNNESKSLFLFRIFKRCYHSIVLLLLWFDIFFAIFRHRRVGFGSTHNISISVIVFCRWTHTLFIVCFDIPFFKKRRTTTPTSAMIQYTQTVDSVFCRSEFNASLLKSYVSLKYSK